MEICPNCEKEITKILPHYCPNCDITFESFSIASFLKGNFQLFTIIGVIGTMLSLYPTLSEKLIGTNWISEVSLTVSLIFLIYFGNIFLIIVFLIILKNILQFRSRESIRIFYVYSHIVKVKNGDLNRGILLFCLIPMMFAFLTFNIGILFLIPNFLAFVVFGLLVTISMYTALLFYEGESEKITEQINLVHHQLMRHKFLYAIFILISIVVIIILVAI
jgi:hypothetical protein